MTWTESAIGVGLSILITVGVLLAAYSPLYLMSYLRQVPLHQVPGFINAAICMIFAWRVIRAYSTGSIKRRHYLAPIQRRDRAFAFWAYISLDMLLIATLGYLAW